MRIAPINQNRFSKISSINNYKNQNINIYNSKNSDVVSFSGTGLPGTQEIISIQNTYQTPISTKRAIKATTSKAVKNAFYKEFDYNRNFDKDLMFAINQRNKIFNATETVKKEPMYKAIKMVEDFCSQVVCAVADPQTRYVVPNAVAIVSEDKKLADDFIDTLLYKAKERTILHFVPGDNVDKYFRTIGPFSTIDYEKLPDTFATAEELQEAISNAFDTAKQKFEKDNIRTILHVENMESVLNKNNSPQNIACMKDLLSSAWEDARMVFVFGLSDKDNCDTGSIMAHRVGKMFDLDANGITAKEVKTLGISKGTLERATDRVQNIVRNQYQVYKETVADIKELQDQCRLDVQAVKDKYPKPRQPKVKVKSDVVENALSRNKKIAIAFGAVAAIGIAAGALYKNYVKNKAEKTLSDKEQQAAQPVVSQQTAQPATVQQPVTAPVQKTTNLLQQRLQVNA